jgi:hypothetical protein
VSQLLTTGIPVTAVTGYNVFRQNKEKKIENMETKAKTVVASTISNIIFRKLGNNDLFRYKNAVKINLVFLQNTQISNAN